MDERAFERMYEQHAGAIAAYALRRVRSEQDAEEIVAETFLIAWRRASELQGDPLPWLYGVARRVVANHARQARRAAIELRDDVVAPLDTSSERAALVAAVLRLPAIERDALLLTVWEGLDQRECARVLGCSRIAVALRLRRARARLRVDRSLTSAPRLIPRDTR
ncbi:MAG: sigma-70 family RNA polymerase sigma factor [Gaiellales bacterium]